MEYDRKLIEKNREIDQRRKGRRGAATAKLDAVIPCLVDADLAKMRVADIVLQLHWHRELDSSVPRNKGMPKRKEDKLKILREAVARYTSGKVTREPVPQTQTPVSMLCLDFFPYLLQIFSFPFITNTKVCRRFSAP